VKTLLAFTLSLLLLAPAARASVDDALSYALQAARPYIKEGFTVREDYWGGDLPVGQRKAIVHQLFKGNEYWFWMGTNTPNARISVHIYDAKGNLAEVEYWPKPGVKKPNMAAARIIPKASGSYYLMVEIEKSPLERTNWALVYGFR